MEESNVQSKSTRVLAILQLCMAFTLIMGYLGYPFMGELYKHKSDALLYHTVMGNAFHTEQGTQALKYQEKLERNRARFLALPQEQQQMLIQAYQQVVNKSESSFLQKIERSFHILAFEIPAFERAWIFFSIIISVFLLMRIEGAAKASWILPLLSLCYAWNNYWHGQNPVEPSDHQLFPSEKFIVENYLQDPLSDKILEQQPQLMLGWKKYLIKEWAKQTPSEDLKVFDLQAEEGEFFFNVARLRLLSEQSSIVYRFNQRESIGILFLYFIWNLFLALKINRLKSKNNILVLSN